MHGGRPQSFQNSPANVRELGVLSNGIEGIPKKIWSIVWVGNSTFVPVVWDLLLAGQDGVDAVVVLHAEP